jgi:hypothetical protein
MSKKEPEVMDNAALTAKLKELETRLKKLEK